MAEMIVKIGAEASEFRQEMQSVSNEMKQTSKGISEEAKGLAKGFALSFAAAGVAGAGFAIKLAGDMEQNKVAFTTMLGSVDAANAHLQDLKKFAASTPFELPGLIDASKSLLAMGYSAQQVIPMMKSVGDASAGLGLGEEGIQRMINAFGKMKAVGKASGETIQMLADAKIPALKMLADAMGVSVGEMQKKISAGAIDADTAIGIITKGMDKKFGGLMDAQSKTTLGLFSSVVDNARNMAVGIGDALIKGLNLKPALEKLGNALGDLSNAIESKGIKRALSDLIPPGMEKVVVGVAGAIGGVLAFGFYLLAAAILPVILELAPFLLIGAAVALLAYTIYKNWNVLTNFFTSNFPGAVRFLVDTWHMLVTTVKKLWGDFQKAAVTVFDYLAGFWKAHGDQVIATFKWLWSFVSIIFEQIGNVIMLSINVVSGVIKTVMALIRGDWSGAWDGIKGIAESVWGFLKKTASLIMDALRLVFSDAWEATKTKAQEIWNSLVSWLGEKWNMLKDKADEIWAKIGTSVEVVAGVIGGLLIPKMILLGTTAVVEGAKVVASWVTMQAQAIATATAHAIEVFPKLLALWVQLGLEAAINAGKVIAGWVAMAASAVVDAALMAVDAAIVVGSWIAMGAQATIQAIVMAAAWVIALGPIAWVIAIIVGLAILIYKNWDSIKAWTIQAWSAVVKYVSDAWNSMVAWITQKASDIKNSVIGHFQGMVDWIENLPSRMLNAGREFIRSFVRGVAQVQIPMPTFSIKWDSVLGVDIPSGFDIGVNWKSLGSIFGFAKGGIALGPTLGVFGEAGPEAVIPLDRLDKMIGGAGMTLIIEMDGRQVTRTIIPYIPGEVARAGVRVL